MSFPGTLKVTFSFTISTSWISTLKFSLIFSIKFWTKISGADAPDEIPILLHLEIFSNGTELSELIHSESSVPLEKISQCNTIGISSGASAPEVLVQDFIEKIKEKFNVEIQEIEIVKENVTFKVPGKLN